MPHTPIEGIWLLTTLAVPVKAVVVVVVTKLAGHYFTSSLMRCITCGPLVNALDAGINRLLTAFLFC